MKKKQPKSSDTPMTKKKWPKFVLVEADDWEALYVDGKCVEQHHHVNLVAQLRAYGIDIESKNAYSDPGLDSGAYPDDLNKVTFDT